MKRDYLSISKRDADCYDVYDSSERVAALRSDFTEDENHVRTAIPGTWIVRWEEHDANGRYIPPPEALAKLRFQSVHSAFAFFCEQVLN